MNRTATGQDRRYGSTGATTYFAGPDRSPVKSTSCIGTMKRAA